nr:PHP domain-containing protein [Clostridiales bacterium]
MLLLQPCYDLDCLARKNLHIHTCFSSCGKPEMNTADIIARAEECGLEEIALTDHYNDDIDADRFLVRIAYLRREASKAQGGLKVHIGAELSCYAPGQTLEPPQVRQALDFRLYSCNHYHLDFWGQPDDLSPRGYALHSIETVGSLIESGKAHGIAHPFIGRFIKAHPDRTAVTREIGDNELGELMERSARKGCAWEINTGAVVSDPCFARRLWHL